MGEKLQSGKFMWEKHSCEGKNHVEEKTHNGSGGETRRREGGGRLVLEHSSLWGGRRGPRWAIDKQGLHPGYTQDNPQQVTHLG